MIKVRLKIGLDGRQAGRVKKVRIMGNDPVDRFEQRNLLSRWTSLSAVLVFALTIASSVYGQDERREKPPEGRPPKSFDSERGPRREGLPDDRPRGPHRDFGPNPRSEKIGGPPMWNRLSAEERERIQKFMRENFPGVFEELEQMRIEHRERFERRIRRVIPDMWELMDLMEIDPDRGRLMIRERRIDIELRKLGAQYRMSKNEDDKGRLMKSMRDLGAQAFEVRHEREALEIRDIEDRLQELKDRHVAAEEERETWIEDHVQKRIEQPGEPMPPPLATGQRP